jgi:hypothetical protein
MTREEYLKVKRIVDAASKSIETDEDFDKRITQKAGIWDENGELTEYYK